VEVEKEVVEEAGMAGVQTWPLFWAILCCSCQYSFFAYISLSGCFEEEV